MSAGGAHGDDVRVHGVVLDSDGGPKFRCTAPEDAPCRTYPTCDCDSWCCCERDPGYHDEGEHCCMTTEQPGQSCWIEPWVNTDPIETYDGTVNYAVVDLDDEHARADAALPWRAGPVAVEWHGDYVTWEYAS